MTTTLDDTNRCVMCGLCLPHCPTYIKTLNEAESPRGRISLIQAMHKGELPVRSQLEGHLNSCLGCRACEAVCPAAVPYGDLIDLAHESILHTHHKSIALWLSYFWLRWRSMRTITAKLIHVYQRSGAQNRVRKLSIRKFRGLRRLESFITVIKSGRIQTDETNPKPGSIALFTGCVAEVFDRDTLHATKYMLTRLGYHVYIPQMQTCCGALHLHKGDTKKAKKFMRKNSVAFSSPSIEQIVSTSSGCGATLAEVPKYQHNPIALEFKRRHCDINEFLAQLTWPDDCKPAPARLRVAVHTPCSLVHVLKQESSMLRLLSRIPHIEVVEIPENARCCGAGGSSMLSQPTLADALVEDKIQHISDIDPDIIVTANIGCRLHLQAALERAGKAIEVIHPVTLLARQMAAGIDDDPSAYYG